MRARPLTQAGNRHQTLGSSAFLRGQVHGDLARQANLGETRLRNVCNESKEYGSRLLLKRGNTKRRPY